MKLVGSLKKRCEKCYFVRRGKRLFVKCESNPRHKQRQGRAFGTFDNTFNGALDSTFNGTFQNNDLAFQYHLHGIFGIQMALMNNFYFNYIRQKDLF
ncbi:unnamed protein product [Blepharisma stoltei]|uniref:Ribosomal protein n=1 Tax=Blepharisma stoltei TaxID=1481888 RepID=A0AAU9I7T8_9CILI|nr:unnamed protein product [Blepharisma stoltei]